MSNVMRQLQRGQGFSSPVFSLQLGFLARFFILVFAVLSITSNYIYHARKLRIAPRWRHLYIRVSCLRQILTLPGGRATARAKEWIDIF